MEIQKALKFLENFSVITVGDNKTPNFSWKEQQSKKLTEIEFTKRFCYNGGVFTKEGLELPPTRNIGIVTGFDFMEVIDVDTKVFSTQIEKDEFWKEFLGTLKDNILDFDTKFSLYETKSGGFHIIYKSKRVVGSKKIAVAKGHKEALIESRGIGGYVFIYPDKKVGSLSYFDIEFISDADRELLWNVCKSYNHIGEVIEAPKKEPKIYKEGEVTPWDDFNNKTDIWNVISDDFFIPSKGQKSKHYLIKRHGSESAHSGYIFKDSGCMYLFSTGTIYPHEKLISPFTAYCYKYHSGDFKEGTKDLYEQGFGSRLQKKIDELKPKIVKEKIVKEEQVDIIAFPLDVFPDEIQFYIKECQSKLDANADYMGSAMLWLISICIGNSMEMEVKKGWYERAVVWVSVVGKAGIGKTPSINNIISPLMRSNSKEIKNYIKKQDEFDFYSSLSKKEKEEYPATEKPRKTQFIANDITLEALVELHQESDNSIGVFKDELAGWLKDMNKYRAGSDLEFWLSCWNSQSVSMNRKSTKSTFVEKPFISVLGGIQPSILQSLSSEENKENGFMDRMLFSFPVNQVEKYNDSELDYQTIKWFSESMIRFFDFFKGRLKRNQDGDILTERAKFTPEAKVEWIRIFNEITDNQNDENENEYLKSMYPKQKSYIPRFALLINTLDSMYNEKTLFLEVSKDSVLKAEKISKYFVSCAKRIKFDTTEINDLKKVISKVETTSDKIIAMHKSNPDFNRTKVAEILGVSRRTVINLINKL